MKNKLICHKNKTLARQVKYFHNTFVSFGPVLKYFLKLQKHTAFLSCTLNFFKFARSKSNKVSFSSTFCLFFSFPQRNQNTTNYTETQTHQMFLQNNKTNVSKYNLKGVIKEQHQCFSIENKTFPI